MTLVMDLTFMSSILLTSEVIYRQGASLMAPGKSGLHVCGERVRVISIEPWKQIRASRHVEVGLSRSFSHCGRKPWVPSTCAGDLMELLRVPLRSQGHCGVGRGLSGLHCPVPEV